MPSAPLYDTIGAAYTVTRRTEPRIAEQVWAALGDAQTVLNVGAGTGSYEPPGRDVTAVEPSAVMRAQRPAGAAPCVDAVAESLPFEDQSFDAAMAFATIDHWQDPIAGLREMRRVARRVVAFTYDASDPDLFWLIVTTCPSSPAFGRPAFANRAGPRDRSPDRAGARSVGLRGRLLPRLLAPARGIPGRACPPRNVGLGQGRAGRRAAGSAQPPRRPRIRPVGRTQPRLADLDAAELGDRLLIA